MWFATVLDWYNSSTVFADSRYYKIWDQITL
jgi:hypothetical protein